MPDDARAPRVLELRLTHDPRDPAWRLPVGAAGSYGALLGWVQAGAPVDAGVPDVVAGIVARAACRAHVLTFLHPRAAEQAVSSRWTGAPWGWTCEVRPAAWKRVLGHAVLPLLATSDPDVAVWLFHAEPFDWALQGQVVLLSDPGSAPPPLEYEHLARLFGEAPLELDALRLPAGFTALLVPGVDGDFIQLAAFDEDVRRELAGAIARECAAAGVAWKVVPEPEFRATAWHRGRDDDRRR